MKEDIAGSNERGTRREERTRQGKEIGQIYGKRKRSAGEGKYIYNRGAGESRGKKTVLLPLLQFLLGFLFFDFLHFEHIFHWFAILTTEL